MFWIRKLLQSEQNQWITMFESTVCKIKPIFELGYTYCQNVAENCKNLFWKDTINGWAQITKLNKPKSRLDIL